MGRTMRERALEARLPNLRRHSCASGCVPKKCKSLAVVDLARRHLRAFVLFYGLALRAYGAIAGNHHCCPFFF